MTGRKRTTLTNVAFGYAQFALSLVSGLVLIPFYLDYIPIQLFGAWLATGGLVTWLTMFDPGTSNILMQKVGFAVGKRDNDTIGSLFNIGLVLASFVALLVCSIGLATAEYLINWLDISGDTTTVYTAFKTIVISTAIMGIAFALIAINFGFQSAREVGAINLLAALSKIGVSVYLLISGVGLMSLAYAELCHALILLCLNVVLVVRNFRTHKVRFSGSFSGVKKYLSLSLYNYSARFGKIVTNSMDAVLISRFIDQTTVASYALTLRGPQMGAQLVGLPVGAFRPAIAHVVGDGNLEKSRFFSIRLIRFVIWMMGLLFIGVVLFNSSFVTLWVGAELFAGEKVSLLIGLLIFLKVWVTSTGMISFSLGNIKSNSLVDLMTAVVMLPLMIIGTAQFGLLGLVFAQISAYLLTSAWMHPLNLFRRIRPDRSEILGLIRELIAVLVACVVCFTAIAIVNHENWLQLLFAGVSCCAFYVFAITIMSGQFRYEFREAYKYFFDGLRGA